MSKDKKLKLKEVPLISIAEELITKYGMHTIQERALPDYRDGLKPVHRRILYAMFKMGLKASGPFRKSATVVGEVIGAYHPHGDTAIYDSMVTMANLPVKLIDGQGSWGLPYEGDKAAAYRYCVVGDTRISTNNGIVRIKDLPKIYGQDPAILKTTGASFNTPNLKTSSLDGEIEPVSKWINSGKHKVIKVKSSAGEITCTPNHPFLVVTSEGKFKWIEAQNLKEGDFICKNRKSPKITGKELSPDMAAFLGYIVSDGHVRKHSITFNSAFKSVNDDFIAICGTIFNKVPTERFREPNSYGKRKFSDFEIGSVEIAEQLKEYGLYPGNSYSRVIPEEIWSASDKSVKEFISAYFEGNGSICLTKDSVRITAHSVSKRLLKELSLLLWTRFGILLSEPMKEHKDGNNYSAILQGMESIKLFLQTFPFRSKRKYKIASACLEFLEEISDTAGSSKVDVVPFAEGSRTGLKVHKTMRKFKENWNSYSNEAKEIYRKIYESDYLFVTVKSITPLKKKRWVYDLTVPETHAFTANGFVVHNTECKLTPYAENRIVHPDYMVLAKLHPNYNNETTEPLFIPAIVPNLFLNGTYGIATGATGIMPPFHPDGIFRLVERAIKGESITAKACVKNLRLNYPNGGTFACDEDYLRGFFKTGRAGLPLQVDYELDLKKRLIIITGAPFGVTVEKVVKRLSENKHVAANGIQNFINGDHPINTFIRLKNTISEKEVSGIAEELCRKLNYTLAANVAITERIDEEKGNFEETNLPNLIGEWAKYRIQLERDVQDAKIAVLDKKVADNELFILAASKLDAVFQALKSTNTKQVLMEKLKIEEEQAARIMAMTVGSLSRLSKDKCQKEIEQWNKDKKSALNIKKEPNARVMELMNIAA